MSFTFTTLPPPYSPSSRPLLCPPSPSQPPTPAYSQPPTPAYSCPPTPYSPHNHHPPSPMPAFSRPPPSPHTMPPTPGYSMPPTPFSPPPASPCPPTTAANTNNLIYCTPTPTENTEAKIEKSSNKHRFRSDARPHPYEKSKSNENTENDLDLNNLGLTPSEKEVFDRCLDAAVQDPAPHMAANFRQPVDVKPQLSIGSCPSVHNQAIDPNLNPTSSNNQYYQQPAQYSRDVQLNLPKREIVLDGVNIGKTYGRSKFSALGVEKTLNYFTSRGFEVCFPPCLITKLVKTLNPSRCEFLCRNQERIERTSRTCRKQTKND